MNTIALHKTRSHKQTKEAQILRYEQEMKECLEVQLDQSARLKMAVEEKKRRTEKALPKGTSLGNLQQVIMGTTSQKVRNAAEDLRDKLAELDRLAASIKECRELLEDINLYLKAGTRQMEEALDKNREANEYLKKGNQEVRKAVDNQKRKRCRKWIIILVALLVLAAIGIVLYKFIPWN